MLRNFFAAEVPTRRARCARAAAVLLLLVLCLSCGQTYRPVATPIIPSAPNPNFSNSMIVVSSNGATYAGATTRIDVSGDSNVGVAPMGLAPVHAASLPNGAAVYVANSGDDTISTFVPTNVTPITTISLPTGSVPVYVATTENATVYVANAGNNTVSAISTANNVVIAQIPVGVKPVAMAEIPNGQTLYVANQGNGVGGSVTSINTFDKTVNPPIANGSWISPVWVAARSDSQRVYVLDSGTGMVSAINTFTNTVLDGVSVGVGANFMFYDPSLNRLYVANPVTEIVNILDASQDTLPILAAISFTAGAGSPCPAGCSPLSVTALPNGSRAYVATAAVTGTAPSQTVTSQVTVINAPTNTIKTTIPIVAVPLVCATKSPYELYTAASADNSRVYVGNCDAGTIAIIAAVADTSPGDTFPADTLVTNMPAPFSSLPPPPPTQPVNGQCPGGGVPEGGVCILPPPPQNPVFVLAGQQ